MHHPSFAIVLYLCFLGCSPPADETEGGDAVVAETSFDTATTDTFVDASDSADDAADSITETGLFDSATSDSGADGPSDGDAAVSCSSLVNVGSDVVGTRVAAAPPTMLAGGPLADGVYVVTKLTEYTGVGGATGTGATLRATLSIDAGKYETVPNSGSGSSGTITRSGSTLELVQTCPTADTTVLHYETMGSELRTVFESGGLGIEVIYIKL